MLPLGENLPDIGLIRKNSLIYLSWLIDGLHDTKIFRVDSIHIQVDFLESLYFQMFYSIILRDCDNQMLACRKEDWEPDLSVELQSPNLIERGLILNFVSDFTLLLIDFLLLL